MWSQVQQETMKVTQRGVLNATEEPQKNLTCSGERSWKFAVDLRL